MNISMKNRIEDSKTTLVLSSTRRLSPETTRETFVHERISSVDIEREIIARERMRLIKRVATL